MALTLGPNAFVRSFPVFKRPYEVLSYMGAVDIHGGISAGSTVVFLIAGHPLRCMYTVACAISNVMNSVKDFYRKGTLGADFRPGLFFSPSGPFLRAHYCIWIPVYAHPSPIVLCYFLITVRLSGSPITIHTPKYSGFRWWGIIDKERKITSFHQSPYMTQTFGLPVGYH